VQPMPNHGKPPPSLHNMGAQEDCPSTWTRQEYEAAILEESP